jgi:hypothetical protein
MACIPSWTWSRVEWFSFTGANRGDLEVEMIHFHLQPGSWSHHYGRYLALATFEKSRGQAKASLTVPGFLNSWTMKTCRLLSLSWILSLQPPKQLNMAIRCNYRALSSIWFLLFDLSNLRCCTVSLFFLKYILIFQLLAG